MAKVRGEGGVEAQRMMSNWLRHTATTTTTSIMASEIVTEPRHSLFDKSEEALVGHKRLSFCDEEKKKKTLGAERWFSSAWMPSGPAADEDSMSVCVLDSYVRHFFPCIARCAVLFLSRIFRHATSAAMRFLHRYMVNYVCSAATHTPPPGRRT